MLSKALTFYFVLLVIQALCAFAEPIHIAPTRIIKEVEGWRAVFRRNLNEMLAVRQTGGNSDKTGNSGSGSSTLDISSWRMNATEACANKLRNAKSSNPAGIAACYNIATFSKDKWTFLADLRLFKLDAPSKGWEEVGADVEVSISYKACRVQEMQFGNASKVVSDGPPLIKEYDFAGVVYDSFQRGNASDSQMRQILRPSITVIGTKSDGTRIAASLSSNDEMFVIGQFAQISDKSSAPPPGQGPFVLPGTRIKIMPIGLIIYSVYMFIGVSIFISGSFQRQRFRKEYRRLIGGGR